MSTIILVDNKSTPYKIKYGLVALGFEVTIV